MIHRRIPFAGALNFRDIGGYPTQAGQTRWGVVYRSDSLHNLTPADLHAFDALGVKAIYDLRRADEVGQHPGPREHLHRPLPSGNPLAAGEPQQLTTRDDGERWLLADYLRMLNDGARAFGEILGQLTDAAKLPAVIHCLGGKDRTGLTVALLLTALGVNREVVLDDYEFTNECRGADQVPQVVRLFVESGMARPAAEGMLNAPRWAMAHALRRLDDTYGGIETYLLGPGGMSKATLAGLRTALVS